jgi:predicted nucleotide-binding protein (sugar kinase/HSP70/actin superfamily)
MSDAPLSQSSKPKTVPPSRQTRQEDLNNDSVLAPVKDMAGDSIAEQTKSDFMKNSTAAHNAFTMSKPNEPASRQSMVSSKESQGKFPLILTL